MRFDSIRFKTNILYSLILAIILIIFSVSLYHAARIMLYRDIDESLQIKAKEVADIIEAYEQLDRLQQHPVNFLAQLFNSNTTLTNKEIVDELWHAQVKTLNLKNDYIHILTAQGRLVLSSANVQHDEEKFFAKQFPFEINHVVYKDIQDQHHYLRAGNFPFLYNNKPQLILQIATPLTATIKTLNKLKIYLITAVFLILVLTSFLGGLLAKNILTPVKEIAETANNISYKKLNTRVEVKQTDEEIKYLVKSFNTMLGRLEDSFSHINEFSSHVAHELKTPLAILRGEIELALAENRSVEEYKKVLETAQEEANRLIKIVRDILLLANLDYRPDIFSFEKIDVVSFIKEIFEDGKILALEKNIQMTLNMEVISSGIFIQADKVHLRRLFFNLINNAIKFTPTKGKIEISLKIQAKNAIISIVDTGIGIKKEDLPKLFSKFFRGTKEKNSSEFGSGLGLSIAQSIAKAHHGEISAVSPNEQGAIFTVTLPRE